MKKAKIKQSIFFLKMSNLNELTHLKNGFGILILPKILKNYNKQTNKNSSLNNETSMSFEITFV